MKDGIPRRNRSPYGWWIASYIERAAWDDEPDPSLKKRCTAWENTVLIKASTREEAYEKAMDLAQVSSEFADSKGRKGHWVFEGLTSLLPIYDELEDGAEILWEKHENRTIGKVRSLVKAKDELEAFDDTIIQGDADS